jgi:hypothetical protein
MHYEHRFSDLTESLKNGFLVDNIVLALARAEKGEPLGEKEQKLLREAVSLLKSAEAGYRWLENPQVTGETKSSAAFFARAVNALPAVYASEDVFLESISDLKATAEQLSSGELTPAREKIHLLRTFFYNAAQSELDRTEQLLAGEGSADVLEWTVTDE